MKLGIIIVNWNTRDLLRRCLETVYTSAGIEQYRVVVVDNGSEDGSVAMVQAEFPQVRLIYGHGNVGYPKGNNIGLRDIGYGDAGDPMPGAPDYALLLNPDTELPPTGLKRCIEYMDSNPDIAVLGPRLVLMDGSLDKACRRTFPSPSVSLWRMTRLSSLFPGSRVFGQYNLTYLDEYKTADVDSVVGAFMLVRKASIETVGLLDEQFFMYGEDLDWAKRIKEAGGRVVYWPEVEVLHVKRAASRRSARAQFEFYRAMLLFYMKHYAAEVSRITHVLVLIGLAVVGGRKLWPEIRAAWTR